MVQMAGFGGGGGGGGGAGVSFPVVFFDGERETEIGSVVVYPGLDFKRFQSLLSKKIGISPQQFSVHLSSPESGRKIPITGKVNFGAISREKGCFFVVVLKRSRRERRRKNNHRNNNDDDYYDAYPYDGAFFAGLPAAKRAAPPENVMILRRNDDGSAALGFGRDQDLLFPDRVADFQRRRESFPMSSGINGLGLGLGGIGPPPARDETALASVCEDCLQAKESGHEIGFHHCVEDPVIFGFRSRAGPIARPHKRTG